MRSKAGLIGLSLALAAVLSWRLYQGADSPSQSQSASGQEDPDYYFNDFSLSSMDESGHLARRLKAPRMAYYPSARENRIEQPQIQVFKDDLPVWSVTSEQGRLSETGDDLLLAGAVLIRQSPDSSADPLTINTRNLHVLTTSEYMETPEAVTMTSKRHTVSGIGLRADLAAQKLILNSRVTASHVAE